MNAGSNCHYKPQRPKRNTGNERVWMLQKQQFCQNWVNFPTNRRQHFPLSYPFTLCYCRDMWLMSSLAASLGCKQVPGQTGIKETLICLCECDRQKVYPVALPGFAFNQRFYELFTRWMHEIDLRYVENIPIGM